MPTAYPSFDHPTFGPTELVPSLVAIRWKTPVPRDRAQAVLAEQGLDLTEPAQQKGGPRATERRRDPRPVRANQNDVLAWGASRDASKKLFATVGKKLGSDPNVAWVSPVYRAVQSEAGEQSFFTVDPTVLLVSESAVADAGGVASVAPSATVDETRTRLLKGYVALNLADGSAVEAALELRKKLGLEGRTDKVLLENIPFISPLCGCSCGSSCGGLKGGAGRGGRCAPAMADLVPNDTFFPQQWGVQRINAPRAWPLSQGDPSIAVAVLDEGVELGHPDLNLWPVSYSTITHTNDGSPVGDHGTACAGIIGARSGNGQGVAGIAGECRIMAISTYFSDVQVAEGLYFAADNGARVVSMSFGVYASWGIWNFAIIEAALQYAQDKNVLLVAASGNEDANVSRFPGSDPRTLCVGGSNRADERHRIGDTSSEPWWGACYGPDLDVIAPCLEIPTTDRLAADGYTPTDYDLAFNGTSAATPHVAGLAGLLLGVNPSLSAFELRQIISETTDKVSPGLYGYAATAGKPYGTWNEETGYGRINVERALLTACPSSGGQTSDGPCAVCVPMPEECCVSPCDPPWLSNQQCMVWYEIKIFRAPITQRGGTTDNFPLREIYLEFRITYEHRLCLLGKQHGPLLYTVTLLPGEEVSIYHSERYRRITSAQARFSVQTTFMQFLSVVHQSRVTDTLDSLSERLTSSKSGGSVEVGGGLFSDLFGGPSGSVNTSSSVTDHNLVRIGRVSEQFNQSVFQASQMTHSERSVVVSTYEEKDIADVTQRKLRNENVCRAVTYFVRKVVELYAVSTRVSDISYRVVAPNLPSEWRAIDDIAWLPQQVQDQIRAILLLLPKVGEMVERPRPISLPTDGVVYDPELANCCSCEPERAAAVAIELERKKAEAWKVCLEAEMMAFELERRRAALRRDEGGEAPAPIPAPEPAGVPEL